MKGDFSRLPDGGRYSGVWMQQGRVQLDQDWNEQLLIESGRSREAMRDLVGTSGAPAAEPGFRVRARGGSRHVIFEAELELDVAFAVGELTVEVRVVVEETDGGGILVEVDGFFVLWIDSEGRPAFQLGDGAPALASSEPLPRGTPVLVSAAYDGRVAVLHLDGRPVAAAPVRRPVPVASPAEKAALRLGGTRGERGEPSRAFGGAMDEVRLWNHARTPAQVREAAHRSLTGGEEGLVAYFPLDEGEGGSARDHAGKREARAHPAGGDPDWKPHALTIGSGRMYVEGIPCINPVEVPYDRQLDYPGAPKLGPGRHLLYVDVWERYLSASEDPALREVALGGLDTTGRTRTVWQVKPLALGEKETWKDALRRLRQGRRRSALAARRVPAGYPASGNRLYRVELFTDGGLYGWPRPAGDTERAARVTEIHTVAGGGGSLTLKAGRGGFEELRAGQQVEIFTRATDKAEEPGSLATITKVDAAGHVIDVDVLPAGLEVTDEPRVRAVGTFLWSTDNAWLAYPVRHLERSTGVVVLSDVGPDGLQLVPGDLVELSNDRTVLLGLPGILRTVKEVDRHAETVTLSAPIAEGALRLGGTPVLRRWSRAAGQNANALPVRADQWTSLSAQDGLEVRFEGTAFRAADYWTIPVRVAAPTGLEWPQAGKRPAALPPQGIEHRYAALATVTVHEHERHHHEHRIEVEDHRRVFRSLVTLTREVKRKRRRHHRPEHHHHHHEHIHCCCCCDCDCDCDDQGNGNGNDCGNGNDGHDNGQGNDGQDCGKGNDGNDNGQGNDGQDCGKGNDGNDNGKGNDGHNCGKGNSGKNHGKCKGHGHGHGSYRCCCCCHGHGHKHKHDHGHDHGHGHDHDHGPEHDHGHRGHGHGHEHDHGEEIDIRVDARDGEVEVDVSEHGHHREDVDVTVEERDGAEVVKVHAGEHDHHHHGHHHHHDDIDVEVKVDGDEIEVVVDEHGRHHDDEVKVTVHAGGVPRGCWVFGEAADAPDGFAATGARLTLRQERPEWRPRAYLPAPLPGRVRCVTLGDAVYAFADGTRQVLRYDPVMDAWWPETQLPEAWRRFAVVPLNGRIHLVGGKDAHDKGVDWHRAYEPAAGRWDKRAPLRRARWDVGAASLGGMLYAAGGIHAFLWFFSATSDDLESYDPDADAWTGLRGMHHGRSNPGVAAAAGRLYAIGGRRHGFGDGRPSDAAEQYDPAADRWKELDPIPTPRLDASLAELDDVLYLAGGDAGGGPTNLVESWVPARGWAEAEPMDAERTKFGLAPLTGRLVAVGGIGAGGPSASVEECRLFYDLHGYRKE